MDRLAPDLDSFAPNRVTLGVPVIPLSVQRTRTVRDLGRIGKYRGAAGNDFILGVGALLEVIDSAFQGKDFDRLITHVEVECGVRFGKNIAEGGRDLEHTVGVPVVEPGNPGGNVHL